MTTKGADFNFSDIQMMDRQIETLIECKPLSENEVK